MASSALSADAWPASTRRWETGPLARTGLPLSLAHTQQIRKRAHSAIAGLMEVLVEFHQQRRCCAPEFVVVGSGHLRRRREEVLWRRFDALDQDRRGDHRHSQILERATGANLVLAPAHAGRRPG